MRNEVNKTVLQYVDITEWRYLTEMLFHVPRVAWLHSKFREIGSGIQVILRSFPQQFHSLQCWHYRRDGFMKCTIEMPSGGMIYIPSFMTISSGIQVIKLLPQQFERLQFWYYWWDWLMNYAIVMASGGNIYVPSVPTIGWGIDVILRLISQQFENLQCWYYWWNMKYSVELTLGGMVCIPSYMMISSGIQRNEFIT
jgi:hypothetical protein